MFKDIISLKNIYYNNSISKTYIYQQDNINKLLNNFNSTLSDIILYINNISETYDYFSFNYEKVLNNYSSILENAFNHCIRKINNLNNNNYLYSLPKMILNEIFLEKRKYIEEIIKKYSDEYNFESIGFKYNIEKEFDLYLKKFFIEYEFSNVYGYFELIDNNSIIDIYINKLIKDISHIKNYAIDKFNLILNNFDSYIKNKNNL